MQQSLAHDLDEKERTKDVLLEENVAFAALLLKNDIKNGLSESGFRKPSPIQFKAIPLGRCGFDLIVKSKSGTGKTLVFSTIALETVNVAKKRMQVLILVPTREIAVQIQEVVRSIGRFFDGLCVESFIGGMPLEGDVRKCRECHIAVGTPGRVKHLIKDEHLPTDFVRLFVLDEADKLMDPSFQSDINEIYDTLPQRKQFIASSATYPKELDSFLANYMLSPTHVTSENETPLLLGLKHFAAVLSASAINPVQQMTAKNELLLEIFSKVSFAQCLVFTNYQSRAESICKFLNEKGWESSYISAAVEQSKRLEAISNLKSSKSKILLSTDVTSRGIDAPDVNLVINYDVASDAVTYLHRMGRAGRYGSSGICINFASEGAEIKKLQVILGTIGATNLSVSKLPQLNDIDLWQLDPNLLEQIWGVAPSDDVAESIKNEVMSFKQRKDAGSSHKKIKLEENRDRDGSKKKKKKKNKSEELGYVEGVLKAKEEEMESLESCLDAEDLLNSLLNRDEGNDDGKKRKRGANDKIKCESNLMSSEGAESVLNEKTKDGDGCDVSDGSNSDRLLTSLITGDIPKSESVKKCQNDIFSKNIALVSITKLLSETNDIDNGITESVGGYLEILKGVEVKEEMKHLEVAPSSSAKAEAKDEICPFEDIFKSGYECAVKSQDRSWLSSLPNEELQVFQEYCRQEQVVVSSESEDEDEARGMDEEDEDEEEDEEYGMVEEVVQPENFLQWVPVENDPDSRYFEQCYEDCGDALWQTGLTFETVADFDDFFYSWQEQLQSVRNYVQQNVYVHEMSKYQQSRRDE